MERNPLSDPPEQATRPPTARQALVVIGMHRSGTSALARIVSLLGAALPRNVIPAVEGNNVTGFWEPALIVGLNDELLASAGSSWDDTAPVSDSWFRSPAAHAFEERAKALVWAEYGTAPLFVLKDPRICRLLPFWIPTLDAVGAHPAFVGIIRNPLEVAASLHARDGFPAAKSLLLWLRHVVDAEYYSRGRTRSFVSYADLLRDWPRTLEEISSQLGIGWPMHSHEAHLAADEFLSAEHRHHEFRWSDLNARPDVVKWVKDAYDAVVAVSKGDASALDRLDSVRARLSEADLAYGPLVAQGTRDRRELRASREESARLAATLEAVQTTVAQQAVQLDQMAQEVDHLESLRREAAVQTESLASQLDSARTVAEELRGEIAVLGGRLAEAEFSAEDLARSAAAHDARAQDLARERESLQGELLALRNETARHHQALEEAERSVRDTSAAASMQREAHERRLADLEAALGQAREQAAGHAAEVARLERALRLENEQSAALQAEVATLRIAAEQAAERATLLDSEATSLSSALREANERAASHAKEATLLSTALREANERAAEHASKEVALAEALRGFRERAERLTKGEAAHRERADELAELLARAERIVTARAQTISSLEGRVKAAVTAERSLLNEQERLRKRLAWLHAQLDASEAARLAMAREAETAKAALVAQKHDEARSRERIGQLETSLSRQELSARAAREERAALERRLEQETRRRAELDERLRDLSGRLEQSQADLLTDEAERLVLQEAAARARDQVARVSAELARARQEATRSHERVEALAADLAETRVELRRVNERLTLGAWLHRRLRWASQLGGWIVRPSAANLARLATYLELRRSSSFDAALYRARYWDIAATNVDPLLHYVAYGLEEGRELRPDLEAWTEPVASSRPALAAPADPLEIVGKSGLFDHAYYRDLYGIEDGAIEDFVQIGWREGRNPNAYFDIDWYLHRYPDVTETATNPIVDALARPHRWPCALFDPRFYRETYMDPSTPAHPLADYLENLSRGVWRSPVPLFDIDFYLEQNSDIAAAGIDPVLHFLSTGHLEGRDPSPHFSIAYYRARHLKGRRDVNPLVHYYETPEAYRGSTSASDADHEEEVTAQIAHAVSPGPAFEDFDRSIASGIPREAKAIAFYLPQFHAIPENDAWWGTGFTEWRNVMRGVPRFAGHYQPRTPRDLGFYDLTNPETLPRQVELARAAGIHGFSFYYYWFNGRRLLERPLERLVDDPGIDFPFCLTWANENWTRTWDGFDSEILLRQDYDPDLDHQFVDDLQRYFDDPRYIRIGGRPLLIIYRLDVIPDERTTIARWRSLWRERHGEEPLIFQAQAFGSDDPRDHGVDAAVEFPPHKLLSGREPITRQLRILDSSFGGTVFDYEDLVETSLAQDNPGYPLVRAAMPSWDNDARRQGTGMVVHGSTPALYERWVRGLVEYARANPVFGEHFVFLNAWNEWAEGAYLEPDVHFGAAYLNATARALCPPAAAPKRKILLVGHDAHAHGAQHILRSIGETLRHQFGCEVSTLLLGEGVLMPLFDAIGRVDVSAPETADDVIADLASRGYHEAIVNTVASGHMVPILKRHGFRVVSLIHELPGLIADYGLETALSELLHGSDEVVVPAKAVADPITSNSDQERTVVVRPQGIYRQFDLSRAARDRVRAELGVPKAATVVLNVGFADRRKGIDTFLAVAESDDARREGLHFLWVGNVHVDFAGATEVAGRTDRIHFVPYTDDIGDYYSASDVFFLTSREDPFPSVVLEGLQIGLPPVVVAGSGGMEEVAREYGVVVDGGDVAQMVRALVSSARADRDAAQRRRALARSKFRYDEYCFDLLQLLDPTTKKISVVVPNYNYEPYLEQRLMTIFEQTYPVFEVIVLDDYSTDRSIDELLRIRQRTGRRFDIVSRPSNSGSVFRQWAAGARRARGTYLWIAEADDLSRPTFLEATAAAFDAGSAFVFSDSTLVDEHGVVIADSYKFYYRESAGELFDADFVLAGEEFVRRCLAERNLVLNVSAVVWDRRVLAQMLERSADELGEYKLTGDWYLYGKAALQGEAVAYVAEPLNVHRRHTRSVTGALAKRHHVEEVQRVHAAVASWLALDEEEQEQMRNYVKLLESQFGLEGDS